MSVALLRCLGCSAHFSPSGGIVNIGRGSSVVVCRVSLSRSSDFFRSSKSGSLLKSLLLFSHFAIIAMSGIIESAAYRVSIPVS
jgi:hypothetical protein